MLRNIITFVAVAIAGACLALMMTHAGPRGLPGPQGVQGVPGPAGPAGQDSATLPDQCQMLFPLNGTETTMYWPCTDKSLTG
jgi:hypothetical protein